jgi:hypothetical protein
MDKHRSRVRELSPMLDRGCLRFGEPTYADFAEIKAGSRRETAIREMELASARLCALAILTLRSTTSVPLRHVEYEIGASYTRLCMLAV